MNRHRGEGPSPTDDRALALVVFLFAFEAAVIAGAVWHCLSR